MRNPGSFAPGSVPGRSPGDGLTELVAGSPSQSAIDVCALLARTSEWFNALGLPQSLSVETGIAHTLSDVLCMPVHIANTEGSAW